VRLGRGRAWLAGLAIKRDVPALRACRVVIRLASKRKSMRFRGKIIASVEATGKSYREMSIPITTESERARWGWRLKSKSENANSTDDQYCG
jgi:hypothetical protein